MFGDAKLSIEIYAAFVRLDRKLAALLARGFQIRAQVRRWTGIPVGVGVAETKVPAKLANRQAKKTVGRTCSK